MDPERGQPYRMALVGCGFFAEYHLQAWRHLAPRVTVAAVCDLDEGRASAAAERFGVPRHDTDFEAMLRDLRPDFVDIVTTAPSHLPLVRACARSGIPAIVQKPLAPDWAEACALVAAMRDAGLTLMVHENFRFQRTLRRALDLVRSGAIGRVNFGRFSFRTGIDIYAGQPYLARVERLVILDLGIHVLDLARAFLGEAEQVFCRTQSIRPGIAGEDMATILTGHAGGATGVVEASYASRLHPDPFPQVLGIVEGTDGAIRLEEGYRLRVAAGGRTWDETAAPAPLPWGTEPWLIVQDSVLATQTHWLDCLDAGRVPETSGPDNLRSFALVEAAYQSAATGLPARPMRFD